MKLVKANTYKVIAKGDYFEKQAKQRILDKHKDLPEDVKFCVESYSQMLDEKDEKIQELRKEIDQYKKTFEQVKKFIKELNI